MFLLRIFNRRALSGGVPDLTPMITHVAQTRQPGKLEAILEKAVPGLLTQPGDGRAGNRSAEVPFEPVVIPDGVVDLVSERLDARAIDAALSGFATAGRWHSAAAVGEAARLAHARVLEGSESPPSPDVPRVTRNGYASLLAAGKAWGGKRGFALADTWFQRLVEDETIERFPALPHFDEYHLQMSWGFDWLIRRYGYFGKIPEAIAVSKAMLHFGYSPDHSTVMALALVGVQYGTGLPTQGMRRTLVDQGIPADQAVHSVEGTYAGPKARIGRNRAVETTGVVFMSPDAVDEGLSVGLPDIADCGPDLVSAVRALERVVDTRLRGGIFPGPSANAEQ